MNGEAHAFPPLLFHPVCEAAVGICVNFEEIVCWEVSFDSLFLLVKFLVLHELIENEIAMNN